MARTRKSSDKRDDFDNPGSVLGEYKAEILLFFVVAVVLIAAFVLRVIHIISPLMSNIIMIAVTLVLILIHLSARSRRR